jgi:hypothetical protein
MEAVWKQSAKKSMLTLSCWEVENAMGLNLYLACMENKKLEKTIFGRDNLSKISVGRQDIHLEVCIKV